MKKVFLFLVAVVLSTAMASAQKSNDYYESKSAPSSYAPSVSLDVEDSFGAMFISYHPVTMKTSYGGQSGSDSFNGVSLAWTKASNVSISSPLFIEYGLGAQWTFKSEGSGNNKVSTNFLSFKIPVSFLYSLKAPGSSLSIVPYVGLDPLIYAMGKSKGKNYEQDLFKTGAGGDKMNRFQIDWHIGARICINQFFINAAYEGPILGFYNKDGLKINSSQANLGIGFIF